MTVSVPPLSRKIFSSLLIALSLCLIPGQNLDAQHGSTFSPGDFPRDVKAENPSRYWLNRQSAGISYQTAESDSNMTLVSYVPHGVCYSAAVNDDIVYLSNGHVLEILDISNPENPSLLGRFFAENRIYKVTYSGEYLFILIEDLGIKILDVSDPANPTELGMFGEEAQEYCLQVWGDYAYVSYFFYGLKIFDISDPSAPTEVGSYETPDHPRELYLVGDTAYVAGNYDGVYIFDVSDPAQITEINSFDAGGPAKGIQVIDGLAYISADSAGLRIFDVSDPINPVDVGTYDTGDNAWDLQVTGDIAYVAEIFEGLYLINISNPAQPELESFHNMDNLFTQEIHVTDDMAFAVNATEGLRIIDVTDPAYPEDISTYYTDGTAIDMAVKDDYIYLADGPSGFRVYDASNLALPAEVASVGNGFTRDVQIVNNIAYVVDPHRLRICDITNPPATTQIGMFEDYTYDGYFLAADVLENRVYLVESGGTLLILDVSDPTAPTELGSAQVTGSPRDVTVWNGIAHIASGMEGLRFVDVSNPEAPSEMGHYGTISSANAVQIVDSIAFIADGDYGLRMINVSNPELPREIWFFRTSGYLRDLQIKNGLAYLADSREGLRIVDITDLYNPFEIGYYNTDDSAIGVDVVGDLVYIADSRNGFYIVRNDLYSPPPVQVQINAITGVVGDTVSVPLKITLPYDSVSTEGEVRISGYESGLAFLEVDTTDTMMGESAWSFSYSEDENLTISGTAGAQPISGSGIWCRLRFEVTGEPQQFVPVLLESATFVPTMDSVALTGGGVYIFAEFAYGDADRDGEIGYFDALRILNAIVFEQPDIVTDPIAADVTLDSTCSPLDASLIMQYQEGFVEDLPVDTPATAWLGNCDIDLVDGSVEAGEHISISIDGQNAENLYGFWGTISYNPLHLRFDTLTWDTPDDDFFTTKDMDQGTINFACMNPELLTSFGGNIQFYARDNFSVSNTVVKLDRWQINEQTIQTGVDSAIITRITGTSGEQDGLPDQFLLHQNYPNPFNPTTSITYGLPKDAQAEILILDITGRRVTTLTSGMQQAGWHSVTWDGTTSSGKQASTGLYFCRFRSGDLIRMKKMMLIR